MTIHEIAQSLVDAHGRRTERLSPLIRSQVRKAYADAVGDFANALHHSALDAEMRQTLSAPSGVQPTSAAVEDLDALQK